MQRSRRGNVGWKSEGMKTEEKEDKEVDVKETKNY